MLLEQIDEPAQEEGQQGRRDGAQQDQGVVAGLHALVDEGAQAAQADHGGQHGPAHGVDHGHAQPADDGGHGQGQLHPEELLGGTHAAALCRLLILRVHPQQPGEGVFQHREHGIDGQGDEDGGGLDVEHQEQQADKDHAGDGVEQGEQGQDEPGLPGKAGEEDTQPQAQDKADGHRDQGVEQMHADASDQGLGVARQKLTHTVTPRAVPPWQRPCWSW